MKNLLFLLLLMPSLSWGQENMVARMYPYVLGAGTVAASSGLTAITDSFTYSDGDLDAVAGSNWTEIKGDIDIASGVARQASTGSVGAINDTACTTVNQYIKLKNVQMRAYQGMIFRYTDASTPFYILEMNASGEIKWYKIATVTGWAATELSGTDYDIGAINSGDSWGCTLTGTGADTTFRCWLNPTGDAPTAADIWGEDSSPDVTYTDDPGANAVDTGTIIGFEGYNASANQIDFDNFIGGDIP